MYDELYDNSSYTHTILYTLTRQLHYLFFEKQFFQIQSHILLYRTEIISLYFYCYSDSFDYSTAQKNIRKNYHEMTYLPINSMLSKLFSEGVITLKEKQQIKACNVVETEQMQYFLDNIIIPSLECKNNAKFKGLLKILKESDDPTSIAVAKKL